MFFYIIGRIVFGAFVGWIIGTLLNRVTVWYDNRRLERRIKFVDNYIDETIANILKK